MEANQLGVCHSRKAWVEGAIIINLTVGLSHMTFIELRYIVLVLNIFPGTFEGTEGFYIVFIHWCMLNHFYIPLIKQICHNVYHLLTHCSIQFSNILLKMFASVDL